VIFVIAARELRSLFLSPLAWVLLAVLQGLLAWIFLLLVNDFYGLQGRLMGIESAPGVTDLVVAPLLRAAAWCLLGLTPLLTMRLFSEERRNGTLSLLLSAPVGTTTIVLGKYLGILGFLGSVIALVAAMPLTLTLGVTLDVGKVLAGLLGLSLLTASFAAAGLYFSTVTTQPVVAAIATLGLLLFLCMIDAFGVDQATASPLFRYLSLWRHYDPLLLGWFSSADIIYYVLFITAFLGLTIRRLDDGRLRD
jgi:ABC-2 type transport system permease protein